jgi:hypothetical protein
VDLDDYRAQLAQDVDDILRERCWRNSQLAAIEQLLGGDLNRLSCVSGPAQVAACKRQRQADLSRAKIEGWRPGRDHRPDQRRLTSGLPLPPAPTLLISKYKP